ncbi:hypothetical protein SAY87_015185 [Trapa incisa]|uniref:Uncharacterized protein n=1 Tax=Trapa incisa TaxID=236973 RepID=A0AAN7JKU7_9MYRT|nr:hypothetical protein SAY87_015185 [Trapa incisa]
MGKRNNDLKLSLRVPLLLIIAFLMIPPHLTSCRSISSSSRTGMSHKPPTSVFYSRFSQQFTMDIPAARTRDDETETNQVYGVSKRMVPGGPNPLHN